MDWFFSFLNSQWTIGIGTGLVSGIGANVLLKLVLNRKDNKEFTQKVATANSEIIYSLRSAVAEESMPGREVVESIARATARKHEIKRESLISLNEIADDLIKEVMDSNFLSQEQKDKYTSEILVATVESPKVTIKTGSSIEEDAYYSIRKSLSSRYINYLSFIVTLMAASLTVVLTGDKTDSIGKIFNTSGTDILPIIIGVTLIPLIVALTLMDTALVKVINDISNSMARAIKAFINSLFSRHKK